MKRTEPAGAASQPGSEAGWLRTQVRAGRKATFTVAGLGLLGTVSGIGQAWCLAGALTAGLSAAMGSGGGGRGSVGLLALFAALAVVRAGLRWAADMVAFGAGSAARRRLRADAMAQIVAAGPAALRARNTGDLLTAVIDRIEALDGYFARWQPAAVLAVAGPLLVLLAAGIVDPLFALVLAGAGLLVPLGMAVAGLGAAAQSRRQFAALSRLQARFLDRLRGIGTIVLAGRAEDEARALASAADELRRRTMSVLRVAFLSSSALDAAAALALVAAALRSAQLGRPGTGLFVILLVLEFFAPLRAFAAAYQDRIGADAGAEALATLPAPLATAPITQPIRTVHAQGVTVAFDRVTLTWDDADRRGPALRDLSFRVPAGETLVLAGPSGAGKSSVFALLLGFAQPASGRVTLNGAEIGTIVPDALSRMTAWVGQRPMLFAGTVRENIRFARQDATDDEVEAAAKRALVSEFADALPSGLDTAIGEGGYGLSGGQAQRVAIARAYLRNAPLLLLDEPTAHLDPGTEAAVLASLRRLAIGRTCILASHSAMALAFPGRRIDLRDGQAIAVAQGAA